ncbi:MAG: peptide chain release factor N(5)-glutamine methyltransferase [Chromatiales bacterium]|nr:peptide chain release factor N(5)-glutamine methyltransferase [Chromatiales bacterium]
METIRAPESTVDQLLRLAGERLAASSPSPRLDAELLLAHVLGTRREGLYRDLRRPVSAAAAGRFAELLTARLRHQPVAYLTGEREFWSLPLLVSPATLIPRPETELLVEQALARLDPESEAAVLDLGTGSGAIALALASEHPRLRVTGTDQSAAALEIAGHNARRLGLTGLRWRQGDWYTPVSAERFALIVSNPPYIADDEWPARDPELGCEPEDALRSGPDGLAALRIIIAGAAAQLEPGGWLLVEHGSTQGAAVSELFDDAGFTDVETIQDMAGHARLTLGRVAP